MRRKLLTALAALTLLCVWTASNFLLTTTNAATILSEGFEAGGKAAYAAGNVTLGSGSWYLNEALTGNTSSDRKSGSWSARVRETGTVRMNFNVSSAGTFTVQHAKYGSDANSTFQLWQSTNGGSSWTQVGSTVTTSSTSLTTATFTVNSSVAVRFEIRKISGGSNRINFDGISITDYAAPTPTPTATPTATPTPTPPISSSVHLTMGNPSTAIADVISPTNYLMEKPQYALSYNSDLGRPNWVSWHLDSSWIGSTPRQDSFAPDTSLPSGWYRVQANSFSGSGYDRGHMCPSADRTKTVADNDSTFLMTNMLPQAPDNNQRGWATLETYCRTLAGTTNELYIISGGHGTSGYLASGNVAIPTSTWKVIMVMPKGTDDVSRVTTSTRLIAIVMPNQNGISSDWRSFRVNVDYIESLTGYDFFSNVPDAIESVIESTVDNQRIEDSEIELDKYTLQEIEAERRWNPFSIDKK